MFSFLLGIMLYYVIPLCLTLRETNNLFSKDITSLHILTNSYSVSNLTITYSHLFHYSHSYVCAVVTCCVFNRTSIINNNIETFIMCIWIDGISSLDKCLFIPLPFLLFYLYLYSQVIKILYEIQFFFCVFCIIPNITA